MAKPKPTSVASGIQQRRRRFAAAHDKGMSALRTKDYDALGDAILEERKLIEEQAELIAGATPKLKRKTARK